MTVSEAQDELDAEIGRFEDRDIDDYVHDGHIDCLHASQRDGEAFSAWCIAIVVHK
jgi:hypothetical protein